MEAPLHTRVGAHPSRRTCKSKYNTPRYKRKTLPFYTTNVTSAEEREKYSASTHTTVKLLIVAHIG